jgi:hypothetical protein
MHFLSTIARIDHYPREVESVLTQKRCEEGFFLAFRRGKASKFRFHEEKRNVEALRQTGVA